jgi:hypothetical protein
MRRFEMVKLMYGIWDFNRKITDQVVLDHLVDLGTIVEADCAPRPYFREKMCNSLLRKAVATPTTHLVVIRSGTTISNFSELEAEITKFCEENDFAMAGHLMQHDHESYPWIHNQFFIMNMDFYRRAGAPPPTFPDAMKYPTIKFEDGETPGSYMLPSYVRSEENIHDSYTPLWIKPNQADYIEVVPGDRFGQIYIACALRMDRSIINLPHSIRRLKGFVYPDVSSNSFGRAIEAVRAGDTPDTADLYPGQKWYVTEVLPPRPKRVFIRNTEELASPSSDERFGIVAAPAAGFKPLALWNDLGETQSRIVIYDFNEEALAFWKHVIGHWNGQNFPAFVAASVDLTDNRYDVGSFEKLMSDVHTHFGGEEAFLDAWGRFQALEHQFVLCDLLGDQKPLLDALDGSTLLSISNIFLYRTTMRLKGSKVMQESFDRLINDLNPNTMVLGFAPSLEKLWCRAGDGIDHKSPS